MNSLMSLLAEDVTFWGDGGGKVKGAATRPITGRMQVASFFLQVSNVFRSALPEGARTELAEVNGQEAVRAYPPKRWTDRALAFIASSSRFFGVA